MHIYIYIYSPACFLIPILFYHNVLWVIKNDNIRVMEVKITLVTILEIVPPTRFPSYETPDFLLYFVLGISHIKL